jgi:hypothetical protein
LSYLYPQSGQDDRLAGSIVEQYARRLTTISFGFGGSNFFASQDGEAAPWYLNPNLTFPAMMSIVIAAFVTVLLNGAVKEKGTFSEVSEGSSASASAVYEKRST